MRRRYVTVDVFTQQRFAGNPLAVVLDADGLSTAQMHAVAREFNYSETTFVLPPRDSRHTARVRIFTPGGEIPFAGHPNVGTAWVLVCHGLAGAVVRPPELLFEERAGLVPVRMLYEGGELAGAELTAPERMSRRSIARVEAVAACLGLPADDLLTQAHEPQVVSVGLPFIIVELRSRAALARITPDAAAFSRILPLDGSDAIYCYVRETRENSQPVVLWARMFSPLDGIGEDPATGSAAAAVTALLADLAPGTDVDVETRITQGVEQGRPSLLLGRARKRAGIVDRAQVAGACIEVMAGSIWLVGEGEAEMSEIV
jgi:trans-2,3-dihydro-3-hydroxyanthranilate isomerase